MLSLNLFARNEDLLWSVRQGLAQAQRQALSRSAGIPQPIPILVGSAQLSDWLQVRLAQDLGLSMGFAFATPESFLGPQLTDSPALATAATYWKPERLRWRILPLVETFAAALGHDAGTTLRPRDRFAFADLLARQFDHYTRHRPDWPLRWSDRRSAWTKSPDDTARADEAWQRDLWCALANLPDAPPHPACVIAELAALGPQEGTSDQPPIFVIGNDLLDPLLLRALQLLAQQRRSVSLNLMLPSLGYLGDQTHRAALRQQAAELDPDDPFALGGHPLLASLGQQAVGSFLLLETLSADYAEWPEPLVDTPDSATNVTLLQRLQTDIREQRTPLGAPATGEANDARPILPSEDHSLRIHACHSARRELEVLRDELLRAFAELPDLRPDEVLIAVTDFDLYAPLVEGVLRQGARPLPVRLTAVPAREANPITAALLALLELAMGRHAASDLIDLLTYNAVQHQLGIAADEDAVTLLADSIRQSGLTHGIDASGRAQADDTGTWRMALDRQLAGFWLGPTPDAVDAHDIALHPLAPQLPQAEELRLRYIGWLGKLAAQQKTWQHAAPARDWAARLANAVSDLLHTAELDDHAAATLRAISELDQVEADTPLDVGALLDWLTPLLDNATSLRTTMGGEILFGRLAQLHGLPCRVFALLGLQDGAFPRASRRVAWDLLGHQPERWDADPRRQDRQFFLDALLGPTDRLILTAANRSLRSPHDGPLSACVEELLRTVGATVRPATPSATLNAQLVVTHPIQPFDPAYFGAPDARLPQSFNASAAAIAQDLAHPESAALHPFAPAPGSATATPPLRELSLHDLIRFWQDPAAGWLRALGLAREEDEGDDTTLDDAPLQLDGLQNYSANAAALAAQLPTTQNTAAPTNAQLIANRALPPGRLGQLAWQQRTTATRPLATVLAELAPQAPATRLHVPLPSGGILAAEIRLHLPSDPTDSAWVLIDRPGPFKKRLKFQLAAYIQVIAASVALDRPVSGFVCGTDLPDALPLSEVDPTRAREQFSALLDGYAIGQTRPLCFAPETSDALAYALSRGLDPDQALLRAAEVWLKEGFGDAPAGEGNTAYAQLAWRDRDPFSAAYAEDWLTWAAQVAQPLNNWFPRIW